MPVAGLTRLRKHQFARQADVGTVVPATRAYPLSGTPDVNLNWTDPEIDVGSLDPVAAPYRAASDLTAGLSTESLTYNDLTLFLAGIFGGAVEPTGGGDAKTWVHEPASETIDEIDYFTYEFGDDVLTDWYQFGDGILESVEISGPEGLGPLSASGSWRFGSVASTGSTDAPVTGTVPTPGLSVDPAGAMIYLKDGAIDIASSVAGLAAGQVSDALHSFVLRVSGDIDQKRWANGDQSFDVDEFARASRMIELECVFSKTADIVGTGSESDSWMSDTAVNRYVRLRFLSTVVAQEGSPDTFYAWTVILPLRYYTRAEGESGGNTTVTLTGHAFFDADDLDGVFSSTLVNTLTGAELGDIGS